MTLETIYDGDGSDVTFNTNFNYLEKEDISVAVKPSGGSYATKTLDTHYTVSGQVVTFTSGNVPPNNSKVRIFGDYVYKYAKPLNSSNVSECALTFSETLRCARCYYKYLNLDGGKKANEFDTAIKRAIAKITEDKDSEEPFEISSGNSQTYVSNLVVVANQWLSQLRQAREDKKKEIRGVKEEIKNTSNKTKVKKAS